LIECLQGTAARIATFTAHCCTAICSITRTEKPLLI
jgi:hypothetical protein